MADGRHRRDSDSGGEGDVACGDAIAVGSAVNAGTSDTDSTDTDSPDTDSPDTDAPNANASDSMKSSVADSAVTNNTDPTAAPADHAVTNSSVSVMDGSPVDDHACGMMSDPMANHTGSMCNYAVTNCSMSDNAMIHGTMSNDAMTNTMTDNAMTNTMTDNAVGDATVANDSVPDADVTDGPMPDSDTMPNTDVAYTMCNAMS